MAEDGGFYCVSAVVSPFSFPTARPNYLSNLLPVSH